MLFFLTFKQFHLKRREKLVFPLFQQHFSARVIHNLFLMLLYVEIRTKNISEFAFMIQKWGN